MAKYTLVVTSAPKKGREEEYVKWYDGTHIKDVCSVAGVKSGRRLTAVPEISPTPPLGTQIAIYEIESDDPGKIMEEIGRRSQSGEFESSDALDPESPNIWFYRQD